MGHRLCLSALAVATACGPSDRTAEPQERDVAAPLVEPAQQSPCDGAVSERLAHLVELAGSSPSISAFLDRLPRGLPVAGLVSNSFQKSEGERDLRYFIDHCGALLTITPHMPDVEIGMRDTAALEDTQHEGARFPASDEPAFLPAAIELPGDEGISTADAVSRVIGADPLNPGQFLGSNACTDCHRSTGEVPLGDGLRGLVIASLLPAPHRMERICTHYSLVVTGWCHCSLPNAKARRDADSALDVPCDASRYGHPNSAAARGLYVDGPNGEPCQRLRALIDMRPAPGRPPFPQPAADCEDPYRALR